MAFIDDLNKATLMFERGAKGLALTRALSEANEAVDMIKNSELKDEEKRNEIRNVANQVTQGLLSKGLSANEIAQASETIAPAERFFQTPEQVLINPQAATESQVEGAEKVLGQEQQIKEQALSQRTQERQSKKVDKFLTQAGNNFQKRFSKANQGFQQLRQAKALARDADFASIQPQIIRGILKLMGEGARMSDFDIRAATPGQSIPLRAKQWIVKSATNAITEENKEELLGILEILEKASKEATKREALKASEAFQRGAKRRGLEVSNEDILQEFIAKTPLTFEEVGIKGTSAPGMEEPQPSNITNIPGLKVKSKALQGF